MACLRRVALLAAVAASGARPYGKVFVRRMRKAGSSTLLEFVRECAALAPRLGLGRVEVETTEFRCFPGACGPREDVFLLSHLREPVSRLVSEFWWRHGPGREYGASNATLWRAWIAEGESANSSWPIGKYSSDTYVKMLTGTCACSFSSQGRECLKRRERQGGDEVCSAFVPNLCDCPPRKATTTAADLATARETVLSRFDAVVILEDFADPLISEWLASLLLRADADRIRRVARGRALPSLGSIHEKNDTVPDTFHVKDRGPPPELVPQIRLRNAHDLALYDAARRALRASLDCYNASTPRTYADALRCSLLDGKKARFRAAAAAAASA